MIARVDPHPRHSMLKSALEGQMISPPSASKKSPGNIHKTKGAMISRLNHIIVMVLSYFPKVFDKLVIVYRFSILFIIIIFHFNKCMEYTGSPATKRQQKIFP